MSTEDATSDTAAYAETAGDEQQAVEDEETESKRQRSEGTCVAGGRRRGRTRGPASARGGSKASSIQRYANQAAAVMGDVRTVRERAGGVPKDANPDEVANRLGPLIEQLATVRTKAMGVNTKLVDAETAAKAALKGGQPGPLLGLIGQVRQRLQGASQQTEVARQGFELVIKEARQTGN